MADMGKKQVVEITVKKDGSFTFEAKEGFQGANCREQTRDLELVLGGELQSSKNTKAFFEGDGGDVSAELNLK